MHPGHFNLYPELDSFSKDKKFEQTGQKFI